MTDKMGDTSGLGLILYSGSRDELQAKLRARDDEIERLHALLKEREWRTIESAPKSERVLLVMPSGAVAVGWWSETENWDANEEKNLGAWIDGTVWDWGMQEYAHLNPVGWLARSVLPPPPSEDKGS